MYLLNSEAAKTDLLPKDPLKPVFETLQQCPAMPSWPGWLACLAWLGWLGWIGWNGWLKVPHSTLWERSADCSLYNCRCLIRFNHWTYCKCIIFTLWSLFKFGFWMAHWMSMVSSLIWDLPGSWETSFNDLIWLGLKFQCLLQFVDKKVCRYFSLLMIIWLGKLLISITKDWQTLHGRLQSLVLKTSRYWMLVHLLPFVIFLHSMVKILQTWVDPWQFCICHTHLYWLLFLRRLVAILRMSELKAWQILSGLADDFQILEIQPYIIWQSVWRMWYILSSACSQNRCSGLTGFNMQTQE